ncbi:TPA: 4-oxalocrotonate tautomerase family protein [Burkholderia cepacia]|jgi:4-oxalocrotonate tautomerase
MPGINLTIAGTPNAALTNRLAEQISRLTCDLLKKDLARTRVIIQYVPEDQWFIAGRSLAEEGRKSYQLEVTITGETNTRTEKADYHRAAYALLAEVLGDVHPHSSIHVVDCSPTSYGYGGVTQEYRYQHS